MNIYDISKKAGVSIATVSRVLNGNDKVSEKTRQKVLSVMEEESYRPNAFARGLGLNTMKTIGILCADSSDSYLASAVYYLEQELRRFGYDALLCCTGYELEQKQKYLEILLSKRVDAIILAGSTFIEQTNKNNEYLCLAARKVPIILLNGHLDAPGIYSPFVTIPLPLQMPQTGCWLKKEINCSFSTALSLTAAGESWRDF